MSNQEVVPVWVGMPGTPEREYGLPGPVPVLVHCTVVVVRMVSNGSMLPSVSRVPEAKSKRLISPSKVPIHCPSPVEVSESSDGAGGGGVTSLKGHREPRWCRVPSVVSADDDVHRHVVVAVMGKGEIEGHMIVGA